MYRWRRMVAAVAAGLAGLLALPAAAVAARAAIPAPDLVSAGFVTSQVDVGTTGGTNTVVLQVHLRDTADLPDVLQVRSCCDPDESPHSGIAYRVDDTPGVSFLEWDQLLRVSGTPQDGVWQGTKVVSPAWIGTYRLTRLQIDPGWENADDPFQFPITDGPTVTVTGGAMWAADWSAAPLKVVTGKEIWHPQARITSRVTGAPVGGARVVIAPEADTWYAHPTVPLQPLPGTAADRNGLWTSPTVYPATEPDPLRVTLVFGRRGSAYSLQGYGCVGYTVKMQASATYSTGSVAGNIWPAPSILDTQSSVILQQDVGGVWQALGSAQARANGRYTIAWTPPAAGTYTLRVRVPGIDDGGWCRGRSTAGTTLATTRVSSPG